jgi:hypothetical protein
MRIAVVLLLAFGACTPAQAPTARKVGKVLAIAGVGGLIATAAANGRTDYTSELIWAKVLTERAQGAARDGRCPRVRRLEIRVRGYDRELHDFVFMRDPEILKCMTISEPPAEPPAPPVPAPDAPAPEVPAP